MELSRSRPLCLVKVPVRKLGELGGVSQNFQTGSRMLHNGLPVPGMLHTIMVSIIFTLHFWICIMASWILHNGHVNFNKGLEQV